MKGASPLSEIKKLVIENFQSHKHTELEPAPAGKLTVIVGPSDSGKTAVIRALKWLYYNRPQGDGFIRVGARLAAVTLTTAAGKDVTRQRTATVNRYYVYKHEDMLMPRVTLEGFGNDVPLEVQEITGVRQTMIGDMPLALNLAEQLDGPFLGSGISDPVRARILGKLAGTEEVDHANKTLGTDLYRRHQDKKSAMADIERLTEELKQFEHLPRLQELVEQLGLLIAAARQSIEDIQKLRGLRDELQASRGQADQWQAVLTRLALVDDAEALKTNIDDTAYHRAKLAGTRGLLDCSREQKGKAADVLQRLYLLDDASAFACDVDRGLDRMKRLNDIRALLHTAEDTKWATEDTRDNLAKRIGWAEIDLTKGTEIARRLQALEIKKAALWGQGLKLTCARDMIVLHENELAKYIGAYRDALLMAGQCPTCGGKIDPEKLKGVV